MYQQPPSNPLDQPTQRHSKTQYFPHPLSHLYRGRPPLHTLLREAQENTLQLPRIRRPQPRNRIPPLHSRKALRATALIRPRHDLFTVSRDDAHSQRLRAHIIERARICINRRVDKPHAPFARRRSRLVDERDNRPKHRRRGAGAVDERQRAVDGDDVVGAISGDIGVAAHGLRIVVLRRCITWFRSRIVIRNCAGLIVGLGKYIAEAAAAVDDCFAGFFGRGDACARDDLGCADGGDVGAGGGEGGVEGATGAAVVGAAGALGFRAALGRIASHAIVAGAVDYGGAGEAEFHVLVALAGLVGCWEISFVVAVAGAND
jgi:hypothetical protein